MLEVKEKPQVNQEFPPTVTKSELADALGVSPSAIQDLLNRKYLSELKAFGYSINDKLINRAVLVFLKNKIALLPEDFKR